MDSPITITLPVGETVTMWLAATYGASLDILPTRQAARQACLDDADRAADIVWRSSDDDDPHAAEEMCRIIPGGHLSRTGYTVAPLALRGERRRSAAASAPCPHWCRIIGEHSVVHLTLVALLRDVSVSIRNVGGPTQITVTAYEPGTVLAAGPPTVLTPPQARSLGQTIAGRDADLSRALIAAADLAEGGEE